MGGERTSETEPIFGRDCLTFREIQMCPFVNEYLFAFLLFQETWGKRGEQDRRQQPVRLVWLSGYNNQ